MKGIRILYVEDEQALAEIVRESLETKGFDVTHASSSTDAYERYLQTKPNIILLDVMLPDTDGYQLARTIRYTDRSTPILFLTSKSLPANVVDGFESGGNDYLKKPFSIEELSIRIKVLLSPERLAVQELQNNILQIGGYRFDPVKNFLVYESSMIKLTSRESEILKALFLNRNRIIERTKLLESMWGNNDFFTGRSLDVFITKLRNHLQHDPSVQIINVRGIGYKLVF